MNAVVLATLCGAIGYSLHRRNLSSQIDASTWLLKQAARTIGETGIRQMRLMGQLEAAQAEIATLHAELADLRDRAEAA